eukprot:scaffold7934_cov62-Phaeocystis_antarctica.AAC.3
MRRGGGEAARRGFDDVGRVRTGGGTPPVTHRKIGRGHCEELGGGSGMAKCRWVQRCASAEARANSVGRENGCISVQSAARAKAAHLLRGRDRREGVLLEPGADVGE